MMRLAWQLAWRELRHNRAFALLFLSNLALGLVGFLTLDAFKVSVATSIHERSKGLLAADVGISGLEVRWYTFALTLYAGLTMVTNVPFYSFKDVQVKRSVPFVVIVLIALGIAVINIHPPIVMFGLFVIYGLSGYVLYGWRKAKGLQTSVISTSTDEPDERGLHK